MTPIERDALDAWKTLRQSMLERVPQKQLIPLIVRKDELMAKLSRESVVFNRIHFEMMGQ